MFACGVGTKVANTKERQRKRNANRKALRKARNQALVTGTPEPDINPEDAMQFILDRAVHMLKNAIKGVADLKPDEVWVDTMVGRIPNEWIRLEEDLRKEVHQIAGRMLQLNIDGRRADAAEAIAIVMAPVLETIFKELKLTAKQKARAPEAVGVGMRLLEPGQKDAA